MIQRKNFRNNLHDVRLFPECLYTRCGKEALNGVVMVEEQASEMGGKTAVGLYQGKKPITPFPTAFAIGLFALR